MKILFTLFFFIVTANIFAQGNFTVEWTSPSGWRFHNSWADQQGIFKLNATSDIYHLGFEEISNESNLRFYNGATHALDYNWTLSSGYVFGITPVKFGEMFTTGKFDINGDGINELIARGGAEDGIVDPVNGNMLYSTTDNITAVIDIDGDGYLEIILEAPFPSYIVKIISTPASAVSIGNNNEIIKDYGLKQNYPNPFNPTTTIEYTLNKNSDVKIKIYDIQGKEVNTLLNQKQVSGTYKVNLDGSNLSSGTYFYSLIVDGVVNSKKMLLVK